MWMLGVLGILIVAWIAWFALAEVPVYVVSQSARVQAGADVHPVDTYVTDRVVSVHLPVGGRVEKGDVLLELDSTDIRLRLEQNRSKKRGLVAQIDALRAEISARVQALAATERVGQANRSEALALRAESDVVAGLAAKEGARIEQLRKAGVVPEVERDVAKAKLEQTRATATARARRLSVLEARTLLDVADREAERASLKRSLAELETDVASVDVAILRLENALERHTVRAPITGRLGQVRAPRVGEMVEAGQTVAVVTPEGSLHIVAEFRPSEAVGRIRTGALARMRMNGFPWTKYGMLDATVSAVSSEPIDQRIRVELSLARNANSDIPVGHGLTGLVEVELEAVSPVTLVVREASGFLDGDDGSE